MKKTKRVYVTIQERTHKHGELKAERRKNVRSGGKGLQAFRVRERNRKRALGNKKMVVK